MKIKVSRIKPNPYRRMKTYPIDKNKVKRLETSIQETTFWDNILARPHPTKKGFFQLAYGHHRLMALRNLGVDTIDIPIRNIDNATMLRIMANENLEWNQSPAVINETVHATRDFLNKELAKYETWEEAKSNSAITLNCINSQGFGKVKTKGVGQRTILKFLGGNWNRSMVQGALETLDDNMVDRESVEILDTMHQGKVFRKSCKDYDVPKERQKELATKLKKGKITSRHIARETKRFIATKEGTKTQTDDLEYDFEEINKLAKKLKDRIWEFQTTLEEMGVEELQGVSTFLTITSLAFLQKQIQSFEKFARGRTKTHARKGIENVKVN